MLPSEKEFNEIIDKLLTQPKYKRFSDHEVSTDFIKKLERWLKKIFDRFSQDLDIVPSQNVDLSLDKLSPIIITIGIVLILVLLVIVITILYKGMGKNTRVKSILGETIDEKTTVEKLLERSRDYEADGQIREAVRYSFIAFLFHAHEKGIIYVEDSMTNEELIGLVDQHKKMYEPFKSAVHLYNYIWYGHRISHDYQKKWKDVMSILWQEVSSHENS